MVVTFKNVSLWSFK
ncbi:MAG: hypothetical protein SWJ54_23560 [Cyanobacteriota bacterium]|nr:hypothetical protein [Cyanobacteriota bacterium]